MAEKRKSKKKKGMPVIFVILTCIIVFLCGILALVMYAQKHKEYASGNQNDESQGEDRAPAKEKKDSQNEASQSDQETSFTTMTQLHQQVEQLLAQMTLEEKVAQMFIITPDALTGVSGVTVSGDTTREAVDRYPVGGLIYFESNLRDAQQVKKMLSGVQKYSMERTGIPLFLAVDEEGGTVRRISGRGSFGIAQVPDMAEIGDTNDPLQAYETGKTIGTYLGELGFNVDFAPVADVLDSEENELWAKRSFGTDPQLVGEMAAAQTKGLQEMNVLAVLKHFPGHGSAQTDSHEGIARVDKSKEELKNCDLIPFQAGMEAGAGMIMAGHISLPQVIGDDTPSSLSYRAITEILRNEMGYDGLVVTDALNMGAVTEKYTSRKAAVKAVMAGADLILMPMDFEQAYQGILDSVERGSITEGRIDESVRRILETKLEYLDFSEEN